MTLSVLIVNFNAAAYLSSCLRSLQAHLSLLAYEVCLVDNGSRDGSAELVRVNFPRVRLISFRENRGFSAALNEGLRRSKGRYVLWLNPDAELLDSGITDLIRYLGLNPSVGILGPHLVNPDGSRQLSCRSFPSYRTAFFHRYAWMTRLFPGNPYSRHYLHTDWRDDQIQETDWISGACLLHRRAVSDQLGGLDERFFMYCEDVDFCLRARQVGWRIRYHPGARVRHDIGGSSRQAAGRMMVERHRSLWRYYRKHFQPHPLKDLVVGPAIAARCALLLAQNAVIGKRPPVLR